jgi:hypothetical protein
MIRAIRDGAPDRVSFAPAEETREPAELPELPANALCPGLSRISAAEPTATPVTIPRRVFRGVLIAEPFAGRRRADAAPRR